MGIEDLKQLSRPQGGNMGQLHLHGLRTWSQLELLPGWSVPSSTCASVTFPSVPSSLPLWPLFDSCYVPPPPRAQPGLLGTCPHPPSLPPAPHPTTPGGSRSRPISRRVLRMLGRGAGGADCVGTSAPRQPSCL